MKGVFLALLLCNVAVGGWFGWGYFSGADKPLASDVRRAPSNYPERLLMLSERPVSPVENPLPVKEPSLLMTEEASAADEERPLLCTLVGAFAELLQAEYFVEHLAALDVHASVEQVAVPGSPSFWVYIPPAVSRKEALRQLHELQSKGLDTYIIPKGELENGISFGMFNDQLLADARAAELEQLGYPVKVARVERTYQENWVLLQPAQAVKIDEELWLKLLSRAEKLEMRQNFCPGVANP